MPSTDQTVRVYRELAENYGRQSQTQMRDRFLFLAAEAAFSAGQPDEAEILRDRLLQHNPHHILRPFSSFSEAMKSVDVRNYASALKRSHPFEQAEHHLETMGRGGSAKDSPGVPKKHAGTAADEIKVFRLEGMDGEPLQTSGSTGSSTSAKTPVTQRPISAPPIRRAKSIAEVFKLRPEPANTPRLSVRNDEDDETFAAGNRWVATLTFAAATVVTVLLTAYVFVRPFLLK